MSDQSNREDINTGGLIIFIIAQIVLAIYYGVECWKLFFGKFNYDGWRYLPVLALFDAVTILVLLFLLIGRSWKFSLLVICLALLQNLVIGFGIEFISQVGLIISLFNTCILIYKRNDIIKL